MSPPTMSSGLALILALASANGDGRRDQRRGAFWAGLRSLGRPVRRAGTWARSTLLFTTSPRAPITTALFTMS